MVSFRGSRWSSEVETLKKLCEKIGGMNTVLIDSETANIIF